MDLVFDPDVLLTVDDATRTLLDGVQSNAYQGWVTSPALSKLLEAGAVDTNSKLKALSTTGNEVRQAGTGEGFHNRLAAIIASKQLPSPVLVTRAQSTPEGIQAVTPEDVATLPTESSDSGMAFIDLKKQQRLMLADIEQQVMNVVREGRYIMGPQVKELESALSAFTGAKHVISCSSGTDALLMALMAKDVGPGDAIFTSTFTFIATAEVISLLGATPVFVDIDPATFNIDPIKLDEAIDKVKRENVLKPCGIIPVDLFGLPADYDAISKIAANDGLFVLEDAAQGLGGTYKGRNACNIVELGATSFFPAKPLGSYGDGGAVFTNDDELASRMISVRVHGKGTEKYDNIRVGLNARLDTMQAAILLPKLATFPDELKARQHVADRYSEGLKNAVEVPYQPADLTSAWAQYSVLSDRRGEIQATLKNNSIPSAVYYPKPLHLQTAFQSLGYKAGDFPVSEEASQRIFSLPMHPYMEDAEIDRVIEIINGA